MKIIIDIILLVAVLVTFLGFGICKIDDYDYKFKMNKKQFYAIVPLVLWTLSMCVVFVPANTVGIKYNAFSGTSEITLSEGMAFKTPLDKIYFIDTTVQERTVEGLSGQTKDSQWVTMTVNVKYQVEPANAYKVYKGYQTLDNLDTNLIANLAQRCIEEITTKYNIIEVLGEKRNQIYSEIEILMKEKLAEEGVNFKLLTIKDTDAGESIEKAIQDEAVAKKAVETAEQNREKALIDAETKVIEAQGQADANAVMTEALTDKVLMNKLLEKWDGKLPLVSGTEGNMLDITSLLE